MTSPKLNLDYIRMQHPGFIPMPAPSLSVLPRRAAQREIKPFDVGTAFDRFTAFRIAYLPFVFFDAIWDYIETLMDIARILRIRETRSLCRALQTIRDDYDREQIKMIDKVEREKTSQHAQQFIDESEPLKWSYKVIHSEYRRKYPDLSPDWVMLIAQADLICGLFAALIKYAEHFDKMIEEKAGRKLHSLLPDEIRRMQILIPQFLGNIPHTRIRRFVDAAMLDDFLTQPLTDEIE